MGESGNHEICTIYGFTQDGYSIDVAQLRELIVMQPEVQALFPGIASHGFVLKNRHGGTLRDITPLTDGDSVHLWSGKAEVANVQMAQPAIEPDAGTLVFYAGDPYMVPIGQKLAAWLCNHLGLEPKDHYYVSKHFDVYILKRTEEPQPVRSLVSIKNDNNKAQSPVACDDSRTLFLLPDGSNHWYQIPVDGLMESANAVLAKICAQLGWNAADYLVTHCGRPDCVLYVFPGDKYQICHKK